MLRPVDSENADWLRIRAVCCSVSSLSEKMSHWRCDVVGGVAHGRFSAFGLFYDATREFGAAID